MKKLYRVILFLLICALFTTPVTSAEAAGTAKKTTKTTASSKKVYKNTLRKKKGKIYYYNSKGKIVKRCWKTINGKRYYFQKNGAAATGWKTIGKKRYNFTSAGVMRTGWYTSKKKTYYLSPSNGAMCKGWKKIDGKSYHFKSSGVLDKNTWISSKYVDKNGVYDPSKKLPMARLYNKMKSAVKSYYGTWSVYVKNLNTGESFTINNRRMYAASLIKLYAMGAAYDRISKGKFRESSVKNTISSMITVSSNDAFNTIVRKVGRSYINKWCKSNGYNQTNQGHGLSPSSNNYGLSNGTGSNMTSVSDCGRFLESVYRGTCVSKSASSKMLKFLKRQTRRSKIPAGVPGGVTTANKTGETDDYTHDAAIVYSKGATYIICVMAHTPGSGWYSARNITKLSRMAYNYFN